MAMASNPPNLPPLKPSDQCNKAAHYDAKRKKCVCNNPDTDGRLKDPDRYGHYPEGIVCFDCANSTITRSVVFILDNSGSVYEEGWVAVSVHGVFFAVMEALLTSFLHMSGRFFGGTWRANRPVVVLRAAG
ncbi:hypothetical protein ANCCAN_28917 [Ancylostoma caninum]|uniref:Uncharacterized protein n=1 Tax=Ancylostoma caninum TaxID=29170 RepID=A0A368EZY3_ANCCA|nr:hypothetical protein ANCCAN_28917 [Ancylostoma caninum]